MSEVRQLPQNIEAERCLLSCWMASPRDIGSRMIECGITPDYFLGGATNAIATALSAAWATGDGCDPSSLIVSLRSCGRLDEAGGAATVLEIAGEAPIPSAFDRFAGPVIETHQLRQIFATCSQAAADAANGGNAAPGLLNGLGEAVARIGGASHKGTTKTLKQLLQEKLERMENSEPDTDRISTGIDKLDQESPLRLGDMPLISGERKAGKSIFALNIARTVAMEGLPVLYFSLEDRSPKVIDRLFAAQSEIPMIRHHSKTMVENEFERTVKAITALSTKQLFIRDDVFDLAAIVAVSRQMKAKLPALAMIVADYAQLIRCSLGKGANREQEVATVSRTLRLLSMELNVALLLLCQLNKEGDTRESKALEQDATAMWKISHTEGEEQGKRLLVIPWQRNGESGIAFPISFRGHIARIDNLSHET